MSQDSPSLASKPTRRKFGRIVAGSAVGLFAMPAIVRGRNLNEKLNIAFIGTGGRGGHNLSQFPDENVVALCDVSEQAVESAAQQHPKARRLRDFRRLYDHATEFDAVVVSTTEHTHAFATLPALQLGKHVYCEKPLTRDVYEVGVIRAAAAKAKVATQMGNQMHATDNFRRVIELVQSGSIGPVTEVHVWVSRAWGRQSPEDAKKHGDIVSVQERPSGSSPVPPGIDWDLWLGPAPERPFHEVYLPGPKWYRWWDFANGTMSDLGSHWVDLPFWALKLDAPRTIEAFGPPPHPELAPASMHVTYEYGARADMPPVKLTWYQGVDKPAYWQTAAIPQWGDGVLFVGSKGMLLSNYTKHVLLPENQYQDFKRPDPFMSKSPGHWAEWRSPARLAHRPSATSSTLRVSPRPTTSATSRTGPARSLFGTPSSTLQRTLPKPRPISVVTTAKGGPSPEVITERIWDFETQNRTSSVKKWGYSSIGETFSTGRGYILWRDAVSERNGRRSEDSFPIRSKGQTEWGYSLDHTIAQVSRGFARATGGRTARRTRCGSEGWARGWWPFRGTWWRTVRRHRGSWRRSYSSDASRPSIEPEAAQSALPDAALDDALAH